MICNLQQSAILLPKIGWETGKMHIHFWTVTQLLAVPARFPVLHASISVVLLLIEINAWHRPWQVMCWRAGTCWLTLADNIYVAVTEFSKKTGDYPSLSATDIKLMALTYQLEKQHVGVDHLKTSPVNSRIISLNPPQNSPLEICGFFKVSLVWCQITKLTCFMAKLNLYSYRFFTFSYNVVGHEKNSYMMKFTAILKQNW